MTKPTVREQLAEALDKRTPANPYDSAGLCISCGSYDHHYETCGWLQACRALERHRAEPEEHCGCDGPECPAWKRGYEQGKKLSPFAGREIGIHGSQDEPAGALDAYIMGRHPPEGSPYPCTRKDCPECAALKEARP